MRIAHNVIVDGYRDAKNLLFTDQHNDNDLSRLKGDAVTDSFVEKEIVRNQVLSDVRRLVDFLPPNQRELIYMRFYQQLTFKEIAELTNVSINTSLGRMRYALHNLRRMAKDYHISLQLD
jgi:RNA polymerase sigma-70 factor (ECF subfamily)